MGDTTPSAQATPSTTRRRRHRRLDQRPDAVGTGDSIDDPTPVSPMRMGSYRERDVPAFSRAAVPAAAGRRHCR